MSTLSRADGDATVLLLMPTGRDAALTGAALEGAGFVTAACASVGELCDRIAAGAGAALVTLEGLGDAGGVALFDALSVQPAWSDLPVILFATRRESADTLWEAFGARANITILERPIRTATLLSAVRGALRARTRQYEIQSLVERLEAADRQKDEFLATVSHELRTPLNAMLGWARLLSSGTLDEQSVARGIKTLERNALAQAKLIEDLLDVSRIISGKMRLTLERVDLERVVGATVDAVRPAADAKNVELRVVAGETVEPMLGDPQRLQQIIWNLVSNAVKFTPAGGQATVGLAREDGQTRITVTDTGEGIDPEFLPHVFDRFRQADGAITRSHGGLGLGLAITRHLVELHGGTIAVSSEGPGRGASFSVTLPQAGVPSQPETDGASERAAFESGPLAWSPVLRGISVLVVDDEPDALALAAFVLEQCHAEVRVAASAAEALDLLAVWTPDVLVSDIGMPGEDGYALIRRIRAGEAPGSLNVPAIAATAYARAEDEAKLLAAGYQAHLPKPIDPAALIEAVELLLGTRE